MAATVVSLPPTVWNFVQIDFQLAVLTDDELEKRLQHYYRLTTVIPDIYLFRFTDLVEEAKRRGKPKIVQKVKEWMRKHPPDASAFR